MVEAYGRDDEIAVGVRLMHPRTLRQPIVRDLLQLRTVDPCTHRERVAFPQGRATIWSGRSGRCAARPGANTLAVARLRGVVVTRNVDVVRGPFARYGTRAGMLRLLRALQRYTPPPASG
jgi:hypothetical protein